LKEIGVDIGGQSKLIGFTQESGAVRATISAQRRAEEVRVDIYAAATAAHSRYGRPETSDLPAARTTTLYVADIRIARGSIAILHLNLGKHILTLMFPVRSSGMQRLIGLVPPELSDPHDLSL